MVEEVMRPGWRDRKRGGGRRPEAPRHGRPEFRRPEAPPAGSQDLVYGRHPVLELLKAEENRVNKLWLLHGAGGGMDEVVRLARERGVVFQWVDRKRLNEMTRTANHQGVVARVAAFAYADLFEVLDKGTPSGLLLLDGIEDPHNLGAILRNAAFFKAPAVVIPRWRSAGMSGAVLKASAGALQKVPLAQVANIAQAILDLKERNYWVYGADASGGSCESFQFNDPFALVIGAEGQGLHRLVKERCDGLVAVPGGGMESLNASCASAVLLYESFRRRRNKPGGAKT
jgi:23S rRNA (guanosine2251-2'-O)-methyltransferase